MVARAGKPIPAIFSEHGEAHFRALEREIIAEMAADPRAARNAASRGRRLSRPAAARWSTSEITLRSGARA